MSDLDYAFLAEYATVQDGKLTSVGASYTHISAPSLPAQHLLVVAGRVRAPEGTPSVPLRVVVLTPGEGFRLEVDASVDAPADVRPYEGRQGLLFVVSAFVPLPEAGLYEVHLEVDDQHVRRLAFDVSTG